MPSFVTRSNQKELLDADNIPFEDIEQNLRELNFINNYLGGHAITLHGIQTLLMSNKAIDEPIHIVEIGCGGGDNLAYLQKKLKGNFTFTGVDLKDSCIAFARKKYPGIRFITSDYRDLEFATKPHIIFSSLFCHHFSRKELVEQFSWMQQHSSMGFVINDLHRQPLAYWSIKLLTAVFSSSYLVKNDAPLSVLRAFKKPELRELLNKACVPVFSIQWKWAFRYLVVAKK